MLILYDLHSQILEEDLTINDVELTPTSRGKHENEVDYDDVYTRKGKKSRQR